MKTTGFVNRLCSAIGAAVVGGIGGSLLAAFGQLMSSSALGVTATIAVGLCLGAVMGRLPGAVIGAMYGGLAAALGSVIGGTPLGATLTVLTCTLLVGWLDWIRSGETILTARHPTMTASRKNGRDCFDHDVVSGECSATCRPQPNLDSGFGWRDSRPTR